MLEGLRLGADSVCVSKIAWSSQELAGSRDCLQGLRYSVRSQFLISPVLFTTTNEVSVEYGY